jgi:hypothetical protein
MVIDPIESTEPTTTKPTSHGDRRALVVADGSTWHTFREFGTAFVIPTSGYAHRNLGG